MPPSASANGTSPYPCPDACWSGLFATVAETLDSHTWEVWTATCAALAATLGRRVSHRYHGHLYTMVYLLLLNPTGHGKSLCTDTCRALLPPTITVRDGVQSAEGLATILAAISRDARGRLLSVEPRPAMLVLSEWSALIRRLAFHGSALAETLTDLFNRHWPINLTRSDNPRGGGGDLVIPSPSLSVLGTTTPALFRECVTPDLIRSGFLNRYLILPGTHHPWSLYLPTTSEPALDTLTPLLRPLLDFSWVGGSVWDAYTPTARDRLIGWGEAYLEPLMNTDSLTTDACSRLHVYLHLISRLAAAGERLHQCDTRHVEMAISVVATALDFTTTLLATPPDILPSPTKRYEIAMEDRLLALIRDTPGISPRAVANSLAGTRNTVSHLDVYRTIDALMIRGVIRQTLTKPPSGGRPQKHLSLYEE